jgi:hypothetical protein
VREEEAVWGNSSKKKKKKKKRDGGVLDLRIWKCIQALEMIRIGTKRTRIEEIGIGIWRWISMIIGGEIPTSC